MCYDEHDKDVVAIAQGSHVYTKQAVAARVMKTKPVRLCAAYPQDIYACLWLAECTLDPAEAKLIGSLTIC